MSNVEKTKDLKNIILFFIDKFQLKKNVYSLYLYMTIYFFENLLKR